MKDDHYTTLIRQHGDTRAALLLAGECRKKDDSIRGLTLACESHVRHKDRWRQAIQKYFRRYEQSHFGRLPRDVWHALHGGDLDGLFTILKRDFDKCEEDKMHGEGA